MQLVPIFIHEHGLKQYHVGTFNFLSSIESNSNIDDIFTSSAFFLYCYLFFKQTNNPCFFFFYYNQRNTKNYETIEITNIRSKMFCLIILVIYTTHVSLINVQLPVNTIQLKETCHTSSTTNPANIDLSRFKKEKVSITTFI